MDFSIGEEFRAHVVEVVAFLEMTIVSPERRLIGQRHFLVKSIDLVVGVLLELVSEPCGDIPLLISP